MNPKKWLIAIPARLASTRLDRKPLQLLGGKPLIVRVYENLKPLRDAGMTVVVACDDEEVLRVCKDHDVFAVLTAVDHQSGTDRIYEVAAQQKLDYVLNVQGDEPFVSLEDLTSLTQALEQNPEADLATLAITKHDQNDFLNPNVVKVVTDTANYALYFSRSPIPHRQKSGDFLQHMGIYAYRFESLKRFCSLAPSELERLERLEQLRALQAQMKIYVQEAKHPSIGIDTPEDLERANQRFSKMQSNRK